MRCAVIGSNGLFGQELMAYLGGRVELSLGFHRGNLNIDKSPLEIADQLKGFDAWVNCIGYTDVDQAETYRDQADLVNAHYAGLLAQASKIAGARFVQISTDYVFDGLSSTPYKVDEVTNPQTAYGKSKALGEQLVAESGADYSILRTAWLYGANGRCFPRVMSELLLKNGNVRVVSDQFGQPTWTRDLAELVFQVLKIDELPRIVHAVSSGEASWADFAREVAKSMGITEDAVDEISTAEYPTPARRPSWSVLDNSSDVLLPIGDWRERWRVAAPEVLRGI